ncbi:MAG: hypothetical protein ACJ8M1_04230 [Chthoniobacterales bacterium]
MRKLLVGLLAIFLLIAGAAAFWIFEGPNLSVFCDRFGTVHETSEQIQSITYEGDGSGGILHADQISLSLNSSVAPLHVPSVGSTKDGQLGLASAGKVFPFGRVAEARDEVNNAMTASVPPGDAARVAVSHSYLSWPTPFKVNFMGGGSPSWKRHSYQRLTWTKPNGSKLDMLWRYEQYFDSENGWTSPTMMREGETGLIKVEINP